MEQSLSKSQNKRKFGGVDWTRRDALVGGAAVLGSLSAHPIFAQRAPKDLRRAAVVIGINTNSGDLTPLRAAVQDARRVGSFLGSAGFDVHELTDEQRPVRGADVFRVMDMLVEPRNLDQLVVFFSGHGMHNGYSDFWLLSDAPHNSSETIGLLDSSQLAYGSGIPNVVFISDACRVPSTTMKEGQIKDGYRIFPSTNDFSRPVKVDQFFGTIPGDVSYEVPVSSISGSFEGIFTTAFLSAFETPDASIVVPAPGGFHFIPNNKLETFLVAKTRELAATTDHQAEQVPRAQVTSGPEAYISTVDPSQSVNLNRDDAAPASQQDAIIDIFGQTVTGNTETVRANVSRFQAQGPDALPEPVLVARNNIRGSLTAQSNDARLEHSGFVLYGQSVSRIDLPEGIDAEAVEIESSEAVGVRVFLNGRAAATALVTMANGLSFPLAIFDEFGAHISSADNGVSDLRYNPVLTSERFIDFESSFAEISLLRGVVGTAIREGAFLFGQFGNEDRASAEDFADRVRNLKRLDPTLGIYACYAYAQAFAQDQVQSVAEIMSYDFGVSIFDIALLSRQLLGQSVIDQPGAQNTFPFCPALRPGWEMLRAYGAELNTNLQDARSYLTNSLWTTFHPTGGEILAMAITQGELE
ncbi:caspase family protein [uncultured Tateyamaria sp.]|uniref:caspase family protein n=1 Tax=uncultured Tateyamaria sp. TaxID=455651 RepID=UPI0026338BFC|nr:caspase family protein [uncultured Tateyamaria sp.]